MAWVYILRGSSGRPYIGSAVDLDARFEQHLRGHTATTKRLGARLEIIAKKEVPTLGEARQIERSLKRKKIPSSPFIICDGRAAPKAFGVGREFDSPPWQLDFRLLSAGLPIADRFRARKRALECGGLTPLFARGWSLQLPELLGSLNPVSE
jgi:predicted GIY-YIG superfamily endonuclease